MKQKHGTFTLIEMLIVIVIIGILAAALVPRLRSVQERARDTRRVTDTKQIYTAMQIFHSDNGFLRGTWSYYGGSDIGGWDASSTSGAVVTPSFVSFLQTEGIMTSIPMDPINNLNLNAPANTYGYQYYCYPTAYAPNDGLHFNYYKEQGGRAQVYVHQGGGYTEKEWKCQ